MRFPPTVMVLALLCAAGATGCRATQAQRCCGSSVAVAAGSALVVAGLVVTATAEGSDCSDSFGVCLEPVDKDHVLGLGMIGAGSALVIAGLYGGVGKPVGLANHPARRPAPAVPEPSTASPGSTGDR